MITTVIFDLYDVILHSRWTPESDEFLSGYGLSRNDIFTPYQIQDYIDAAGHSEELWIQHLQKERKTTFTINDLRHVWDMVDSPDERILSLIQKLRTQFDLWLLSNITPFSKDHVLDRFPHLFSLFQPEKLLLSCDLAMAKPQQEIYNLITTRTGKEPHCHLFIDDQLKNVEAAQQVGIQAIRFQSYEQLCSELETLYPHITT